jgi:hypothetical protein
MNGNQWENLIRKDLAGRGEAQQLRRRQVVQPLDAVHVRPTVSRTSISLPQPSGPDPPSARHRSGEPGHRKQFGSGGGLVSGYTAEHAAAEREIASWSRYGGGVAQRLSG